MKKGIIITLSVLTAIIIAAGALFVRDSRSTEKTVEELFVAAAKAVTYELGEYLDTGNEEYFYMAAEDISRMGDMSVPGILSDSEKAGIFEKTAEAFSQRKLRLTEEAERFRDAFELIGKDPSDFYPYVQLKIALDNCGITQ